MKKLYLDTETFNGTHDLKKHGTDVYTRTCELILMTWVWEGKVGVWQPMYEPMPVELMNAIVEADLFVAHNAFFDYHVLLHTLGKVNPEYERLVDHLKDFRNWRCTMARALAHSFPAGLKWVAAALSIEEGKLAGKNFFPIFCKLQPPNRKVRRRTMETDPLLWFDFVAYALRDAELLPQLDDLLPDWNYRGDELNTWIVDQCINEHGIPMDRELAYAVTKTAGQASRENNAELERLTGGKVKTVNQTAAIRAFLATEGIKTDTLNAMTVGLLLDDQRITPTARAVLECRQRGGKSSVAKYDAILAATGPDNRLRGALQFCGAARTGRWSGRIFQPQNLPRPTHTWEQIEEAVDIFKSGAALDVYDEPLAVASSMIRSAVRAGKGKLIYAADYASIEGRVLAWLAGEQWVVDAYARGDDLYKLNYSKAFGVPVDRVTKEQRFIGKVMTLALGYQGWTGAFVSMARLYGVEIPKAEAEEICSAFREANPRIKRFWYEIENAVRYTILTNKARRVGKVIIGTKKHKGINYLLIRLPSGRQLTYCNPQVDPDGSIHFMGVVAPSGKWLRCQSYGGRFVENITQAVSRDITAHALRELWGSSTAAKLDIKIIFHVHDEIVTEAPEQNAEDTLKFLIRKLTTVPDEYRGLPVAAEGFYCKRFKKDD